MSRPFAVLLVLATVGTGCGYRFASTGAGLPEGIRTVCAPIFRNRTAEPALEVDFTDALRQRLARAGRLSTRDCDARMEGEILTVSGSPTVLSLKGTLASYRLNMVVRARLLKEAKIVSEVQGSAFEDYLPGNALGDVLQTEANRQAALRRLASAVADEVYAKMATSW